MPLLFQYHCRVEQGLGLDVRQGHLLRLLGVAAVQQEDWEEVVAGLVRGGQHLPV